MKKVIACLVLLLVCTPLLAKEGYDVSAFSRVMEVARLVPEFKDNQKIATEIWNPIWEQVWITGDLGIEEGVNLAADRITEYYESAGIA